VDATRFTMLPYLLEHTDLIAIVPEYVGEVFTASHRLRLVRLPFDTEPIEVALCARHEAAVVSEACDGMTPLCQPPGGRPFRCLRTRR
jgi:hypothetical protein